MSSKKPKQASSSTEGEQLAAADLKRSGLDLADLAACGGFIKDNAAELLKQAPPVPAIVFPYWEPWNNDFVPGTEFFRARMLHNHDATQFQTDEVRYLQPAGSLNHVYIPKGTVDGDTDWMAAFQDKDVPLFITEGEKKAIAGLKHGFKTVALGGVTMTSAEKRGIMDLEFFQRVKWQGREVFIVFDTDLATGLKPQVQKAADRLLYKLSRLGAAAKLLTLPPIQGQTKVALDDYLKTMGHQGLMELCDSAIPNQSALTLLGLAERYTYLPQLNRVFDCQTRAIMDESHFKTAEGHHTVDRHARKAIKVQGGGMAPGWVLEVVPASKAYLEWPGRPAAEQVVYDPGKPVKGQGWVNMWAGWKAGSPKKGDISPFLWALDNIFADDPVAREFIEHWLFYPIKYPGAKLYTVALVISPEEGIGKTFPAEMLARYVYGTLPPYQNSSIIQEGDIAANFNEFIANKQLVLSDDIAGNEAYTHLARIKSLITSENLLLKRKYTPEFMVRNCANFYLTSNSVVPFRLSDNDRRFFVHHPRKAQKDHERYVKVRQWFESGGAQHVLWHALEKYQEGSFVPTQKAPETMARKDMLDLGKSDAEQWASDMLSQAPLFPRAFATPSELQALYQMATGETISSTKLGRVIAAAGFMKWRGGQLVRVGKDQKPQRVWIIRDFAVWMDSSQEDIRQEADKKPEFFLQKVGVVEGKKKGAKF